MPSSAAARRQDRETTIGRIDVKPHPLGSADVRQGRQRVDRAAGRCAGVRANNRRRTPRRSVRGDGFPNLGGNDPAGRIAWEHPNPIRRDPHDVRGPNLRTVTLVAHVDDRARRIAGRLAGCDECVKRRRGPAAGHQPARPGRQSEPLPEPADHNGLDLARAARCEPGCCVDVEAGRHEVGQHARPRRAGRYEAERPRMVESQRIAQHVPRCPVDYFPRRPAGFRRVFGELISEHVLEVAFPNPFARQTLNPLYQYLCHVMRKLAHSLWRHLQHARSTPSAMTGEQGIRSSDP